MADQTSLALNPQGKAVRRSNKESVQPNSPIIFTPSSSRPDGWQSTLNFFRYLPTIRATLLALFKILVKGCATVSFSLDCAWNMPAFPSSFSFARQMMSLSAAEATSTDSRMSRTSLSGHTRSQIDCPAVMFRQNPVFLAALQGVLAH